MKTPQWFEDWKSNEFTHLKGKVDKNTIQLQLNTKLLWVILGGLIVAVLIEKLV